MDMGYEKRRGLEISPGFGDLTTGQIVVRFTEIGKTKGRKGLVGV